MRPSHAVSAVGVVMALMGISAEAGFNKPYNCPESKYTAEIENYVAGSDDEYVQYTGAKAPSNWDIQWCGTWINPTGTPAKAFPGIIHFPPGVTPITVPVFFTDNGWKYDNGWGGHYNSFYHLVHHALGAPIPWWLSGNFPNNQHPWYDGNGGIDWDYDGVTDWKFGGANEIAAVQACRNKWYSNSQPANFHLRTSYKQVTVHRARNCKNDKSEQWEAGNGDHSPLSKWHENNVSKDTQRRLTFSVLNKPAWNNVKYIAFFVNGLESCKGYPQSAAGSDDGWKSKIFNKDDDGECGNKPKRDPMEGYRWHKGDMYISKHGMSMQFMSQAGSPHTYGEDLTVFPVGETLVVNIPDAAYGYPGMPDLYQWAGGWGINGMVKRCNVKNSFTENKQILKAWIQWLDFKVNWTNIKGFYGVGASRGGCFVTKLADELFRTKLKNNNAKLILETLDPVCAPKELDEYRYSEGFSNSVTFTNGDKSVMAGSPMANLGTNMEIRYPNSSDDDNWKEQNQCHTMKMEKMFGDTPRENIRWLNTVTGENVLGGNVDWTAIYSFCSDKTLGPATDIHTGATVYSQNLYNGSIQDTLAQDIKPKGDPKDWQNRFSKNEDGNPIGQSVPYQNLWLDFENNAFVSGPTGTNSAEWEVNPISWQSVSTTWDSATGWPTNPPNPFPLPKSNNPMPGSGQRSPACNAWYKQVWVPFDHLTVTAGIYAHGNPSADGVGVPCFGQSACGYGVHEPTLSLPLQKRPVSVKNCIPFPRADLGYTYKHAKHAHEAATELLSGRTKICDNTMVYSDEEWSGPTIDVGAPGFNGVKDTNDDKDVVSDRVTSLYDTLPLPKGPEAIFDLPKINKESSRNDAKPVEWYSDESWFEEVKLEEEVDESLPANVVEDEKTMAMIKEQIAKYAKISEEVNDMLNPTDEQVAFANKYEIEQTR